MLNKKFASIRATASEKSEKRSSVANSGINHHHHHQQLQQQQQLQKSQRLSQSQSMEMFGTANYQANNEILMSMRSSPSLYDQRTSVNSSPINNMRGGGSNALLLKPSPHAYVNLLHHQYHNNASPQHLQYQNTSTMSFKNPIILDPSTPNNSGSTCQNQSWNSSLNNNSTPLVTHYTAAQIYMRPKNILQQQQQLQHHQSQTSLKQPSNSSSPIVTHKKLPPEVPKRMSSSGIPKKSNGLSRSSECDSC
jgi:hypothetical protein